MSHEVMPLAELKYVVFSQGGSRVKDFIIFPGTLAHSDFSYLNPTSAGFCRMCYNLEYHYWECYGSSVSLGIKMDEGDSKVLNRREA